MSILSDAKALLAGLGVTLRHMLRRPVTIPYPDVRQKLSERYRARIVLTHDPDGGERCVACQLCSAVCPVDCISMQPAESADGRRYAQWFRINFARCIFCGLCAEACPTMAIQMTPDFEFCKHDQMELLFEKEQLLISGCGKDASYNFYRHCGIGVTQPRGEGESESLPVDPRRLLP